MCSRSQRSCIMLVHPFIWLVKSFHHFGLHVDVNPDHVMRNKWILMQNLSFFLVLIKSGIK